MTNNRITCSESPDSLVSGEDNVNRIASTLTIADRYGALRCRLSNAFRSAYSLPPGLYAVGDPGRDAPVLVTGNYKLTLNILRASLAGRRAWIVAIDTKGINVWCAAGKGTFCTSEIVKQLTACNMESKIDHRTLILPQLAASGVSAAKLQKASGYSVKFGPVRASDLPAYLDNNCTATSAMRRVRFSLADRAKLVPMEVVPAIKKLAVFLTGAAVLFGMTRTGILFKTALHGVLPLFIAGVSALFAGTIATPLLLPIIPGRAFSVKGLVAGLICAITVMWLLPVCRSTPYLTALCLISMAAYSSYLAFLFTGSTTYTSPSGVKKELKVAWPLYRACAAASAVLLIVVLIGYWRGL